LRLAYAGGCLLAPAEADWWLGLICFFLASQHALTHRLTILLWRGQLYILAGTLAKPG
jgi:hypothetical protein